MQSMHQVILHLDADAFFCQVEVLRHPELGGKPLAVYQHQDVISANHAAKAAGVKKHMTPAQARAVLTPIGGVLAHVHHEEGLRISYRPYREMSAAMIRLIKALPEAAVVERASIDEMYVLVRTQGTDMAPAEQFAQTIRARCKSELGIILSVGVSTNKMLAKLASRAAKPDGIHVAPYGSPAAAALIANTDLKNVPQMGGAVAKGLAALGVTRLGQVAEKGITEQQLAGLGLPPAKAATLLSYSRGEDSAPVVDKGPPKSFQVQMTLTPVAKRAYGLKPGEEPAGGQDPNRVGWLDPMPVGGAETRARLSRLLRQMCRDLVSRVVLDRHCEGRWPRQVIVRLGVQEASDKAGTEGRVMSRSTAWPGAGLLDGHAGPPSRAAAGGATASNTSAAAVPAAAAALLPSPHKPPGKQPAALHGTGFDAEQSSAGVSSQEETGAVQHRGAHQQQQHPVQGGMAGAAVVLPQGGNTSLIVGERLFDPEAQTSPGRDGQAAGAVQQLITGQAAGGNTSPAPVAAGHDQGPTALLSAVASVVESLVAAMLAPVRPDWVIVTLSVGAYQMHALEAGPPTAPITRFFGPQATAATVGGQPQAVPAAQQSTEAPAQQQQQQQQRRLQQDRPRASPAARKHDPAQPSGAGDLLRIAEPGVQTAQASPVHGDMPGAGSRKRQREALIVVQDGGGNQEDPSGQQPVAKRQATTGGAGAVPAAPINPQPVPAPHRPASGLLSGRPPVAPRQQQTTTAGRQQQQLPQQQQQQFGGLHGQPSGAAPPQPRQEAPPPLRLTDVFAALGSHRAAGAEAGVVDDSPGHLRAVLLERLQFMHGSGQGDCQLVVLGTPEPGLNLT